MPRGSGSIRRHRRRWLRGACRQRRRRRRRHSTPYAAFTSPFNVTGQPAISLPLASTGSGLPIGVQLVGAYAREDLLLRVAAQLESEVRWAEVRAPMHP